MKIIIIGGGIVGLATAFKLKNLNKIKEIIIIEKEKKLNYPWNWEKQWGYT